MNDNKELLDWVVKNVKEWNDFYSHIRQDNTGTFYTSGESWDSNGGVWGYEDSGGWGFLDSGLKGQKPTVITKEEWEIATTKSQWFGKKYRVTPETSELLQKAVFAEGGSWGSGDTCIQHLSDQYLYVKEQGKIWRPVQLGCFEECELPEAVLAVEKTLVLGEVKPAKDKQKEQKASLQFEIDKMKENLKAMEDKLQEMK